MTTQVLFFDVFSKKTRTLMPLRTAEESTTKSGDHSFKKENLIMPNNRKQAMQRLIYLNFKQFMSNLLVKGYARRMDDSPVGRTWYIPHHGVYHQSKSRKSE